MKNVYCRGEKKKIINLEIETFVLGWRKKATTAQQKVDDNVKVNVFKKFSTPQGVVEKAKRILNSNSTDISPLKDSRQVRNVNIPLIFLQKSK